MESSNAIIAQKDIHGKGCGRVGPDDKTFMWKAPIAASEAIQMIGAKCMR
jgi:hypothetical protein